jgi:hypothetical protein
VGFVVITLRMIKNEEKYRKSNRQSYGTSSINRGGENEEGIVTTMIGNNNNSNNDDADGEDLVMAININVNGISDTKPRECKGER